MVGETEERCSLLSGRDGRMILVTGGCGFIGHHLCERLRRRALSATRIPASMSRPMWTRWSALPLRPEPGSPCTR